MLSVPQCLTLYLHILLLVTGLWSQMPNHLFVLDHFRRTPYDDICVHTCNSISPSDTLWQSMARWMACRLFGAKPLPESMLFYCQLIPKKQTSVKFETKHFRFIQQNKIQNCGKDRGRKCINITSQCLANHVSVTMMTSSNGNIFRVTGPLCGEFAGDAELWYFLRSVNEQTVE